MNQKTCQVFKPKFQSNECAGDPCVPGINLLVAGWCRDMGGPGEENGEKGTWTGT